MTKKAKAPEWRETERRERGLYLSPEGRGGHTFTYAALVYEVTEVRETAAGIEYRTRTMDGPPLYQHEAPPELGPWFRVLRTAMEQVGAECRRMETGPTRKAKR